jgi:hypothetical protein
MASLPQGGEEHEGRGARRERSMREGTSGVVEGEESERFE